jgi:phosphoribosylamine-glycine ligase
MELKNGKNYALKSRTIGILGIGSDIEEARQISQEGAKAITGGALWNRTDVATQAHIAKSVKKMEQLRFKT